MDAGQLQVSKREGIPLLVCSNTSVDHVIKRPMLQPLLASYLKREACAEHQHEYKLKVLINGPQRFHSTISIRNEKVERCRSKNFIGK
jgi:hypothetical protein